MLKDKCAVITGASRGIGKAIAIKFAKECANIVINYRNNEESSKSILIDGGVGNVTLKSRKNIK